MPMLVFNSALLIAVILELTAARLGVLLPLVPFCACYFTMRWGYRRSLLPAVAAAVFTDAVWMHSCPSRTLAAALIVIAAEFWKHYGDLYSWPSLFVEGVGIGAIAGLASLCGMVISGAGSAALQQLIPVLIIQFIAAVIITPFLALLFNRLLIRRLHWFGSNADDEVIEDDNC